MGAILLWDLATPLGIADGILYVTVILIGLWAPQKKFIPVTATICTALTILGFFLSPEGGELWKVIINRGLSIFAIGITAVLCMIHERAERELRESRQQLRLLAARIQTVQEEERTRISREIHDELGQSLTVLKMNLAWIDDHLPENSAALHNKTQAIDKLIDSAINSVRRISSGLRPELLDDLGLAATIEWHSQEIHNQTGIEIHPKLTTEDLPLDTFQAIGLFRLYQEAVTNALRHSNATVISINLARNNSEIVLEIVDNGKGIAWDQISGSSSMGLTGMRERVDLLHGNMKIIGSPGKGTAISIRIPLARKS